MIVGPTRLSRRSGHDRTAYLVVQSGKSTHPLLCNHRLTCLVDNDHQKFIVTPVRHVNRCNIAR